VTTLEVPGAYATVRTNPFTGARASPWASSVAGYHPLQNEEHAAFLNHLADASGATFDTAGSLRGGRQVFVTMRLPQHLSIGGTDRVDLNIAALNSHDGSSAFRVLVTPCARRLREHPARGAARPRLVVGDPAHPQRQGMPCRPPATPSA
jgi:hypothetical protein